MTGRRVMPTLELAQQLFKQAHQRASTAEVNRALTQAVDARSPRPKGSRIAKFYYGTQVGIAPPTLVLFVNDPALLQGLQGHVHELIGTGGGKGAERAGAFQSQFV